MKEKLIKFLQLSLRWMAKKIIKKYQPKVVAITGSVGKTTTKEMAAYFLRGFFDTRKSEKNYNNEIGLPLTIIGAKSGGKSPLGWLAVFFKWLKLMIFPSHYPKVLVLEMGADKAGDIEYLAQIAPPDVAIITKIGISHLEHFKTKETLIKEKGSLLRFVKKGGLAILNADDKNTSQIIDKVNSSLLTFGIENNKADFLATEISYGFQELSLQENNFLEKMGGISFKVNYQGKVIPIRLKNCIGISHIFSALATLCVSQYFKINLLEAAQRIQDFFPPPGRMVLIEGIRKTWIIDDTYNSAPDSVKVALGVMEKMVAQRKIAVLGDMLELGEEEEKSHREVGKILSQGNITFAVLVGKRMKLALKEMSQGPKKAFHFSNPMDAGIFLQNQIRPGDLILVKGSQGMRMEKIVEEIMREPNQKEKLLVRQDNFWKNKEFQEV